MSEHLVRRQAIEAVTPKKPAPCCYVGKELFGVFCLTTTRRIQSQRVFVPSNSSLYPFGKAILAKLVTTVACELSCCAEHVAEFGLADDVKVSCTEYGVPE